MEATLNVETSRTGFSLSYLDLADGARMALYSWPLPAVPRAVVQIAHGLAEHAARYDRLAQALVQAGYAVYATDHRGHGKSARDPSELGYFGPRNGFHQLVDDQYAVHRHLASRHPNLPQVLFGHSFGSFVSQAFLFKYGSSLDAVVLSGTTLANPVLTRVGLAAAHGERLRLGPRSTSKLLQTLSFGSYNNAFKPTRTDFDWLSRDPDEVDKYVADPFCGFDTTVQGWIDLFGGMLHIASAERQRTIPKQLPVYILSGSQDPVGANGQGPVQLAERLKQLGLSRVALKLYTGARHELLNETNREQVTDELISWLDETVGAATAARAEPVHASV